MNNSLSLDTRFNLGRDTTALTLGDPPKTGTNGRNQFISTLNLETFRVVSFQVKITHGNNISKTIVSNVFFCSVFGTRRLYINFMCFWESFIYQFAGGKRACGFTGRSTNCTPRLAYKTCTSSTAYFHIKLFLNYSVLIFHTHDPQTLLTLSIQHSWRYGLAHAHESTDAAPLTAVVES